MIKCYLEIQVENSFNNKEEMIMKSSTARSKLMFALGAAILVGVLLLVVLNASRRAFAVGLCPELVEGPPPPSKRPVTSASSVEPGELAPTRPPPLTPPPPHTGYIPLPIDLSHLKGDRMPEGVRSENLPTKWDWREQGVITRVQDQNPCGACYAFASLANFESKLQMDGAGIYDFSENNAKECPWHDPSCVGSNYWEMAGWFSQKGTVLESCDPYVNHDVSCKTTCPYIKTLLDWRFISYGVPETNVLKGYIQTYGPVYTSMYAGDYFDTEWWQEFSHHDGSYTLYYEGTYDPNHAVLIIGWDDSLVHTGGIGGWIVKNSWGTDWGGPCGYGSERGYFTIAYGSASIGENSSLVYAWQDYDANGDIMYYDEVGLTTAWGCGDTTGWGLCKFIPPRNTYITRVEFYTTDRTTDVDVYIYGDFNGTTCSNLLYSSLNHTFYEAGYHGVVVDPPLAVTHGNDVIAVVKFSNVSDEYPVPVDTDGPNETGRTYRSCSGNPGSWQDVGVDYDADVAIRLRTSDITAPTPTPTSTLMPPAFRIYLPIIMKVWPPIPDTPVLHDISNPDGDGNYTVSWSPAARATSYALEEDDNPAFSSPTTRYTGSGTSWTASEKEIGTYYYRVMASNSWGNSGWSNVQSVSVQPLGKFYSAADTTVLQGDPNENFGSMVDMWVGYDHCVGGKIARSLVQFDVSSIPEGTSISQATLYLYLVNSCDIGERTHTATVYRTKAGWSESSVTWNTKPDYAEAYGSTSIPSRTWGWYSFDMTNLVRGWVNGSFPNYGLMIRGPESSGNDSAQLGFYTLDRTGRTYDPYLSIVYAGMATPEEAMSAVEGNPNLTECGPTVKNMLGTSPGASDFGMFEAVEETVCSPD
jgi:C1A family cysteine protease